MKNRSAAFPQAPLLGLVNTVRDKRVKVYMRRPTHQKGLRFTAGKIPHRLVGFIGPSRSDGTCQRTTPARPEAAVCCPTGPRAGDRNGARRLWPAEMFLQTSTLRAMTTLSQELAHQRKLTAQQLEQRRDMSDQLGTARAVDHSGVFPDMESASGARSELAVLGYGTHISEEQGYVLLEVQKVTPIDPESVEKFTEEVLTAYHRFGGHYDGWGAPIVSSQPTNASTRRSWIDRLMRAHR